MANNATIIADVILKADVSGARSIANSLEELQKRAKALEDAIAGATDPIQKRALSGELGKVNDSMQALTRNTNNEIGLLNQLNAKVAQLNTAKGFAKTKSEIEAINKELQEANKQIDELNGGGAGASAGGGGGAMGAAVMIGSLGAAAAEMAIEKVMELGAAVVETRAQFQKFESVLTNQFGGNEIAAKAKLEELAQLTTKLPIQLNEAVDFFIKLNTRGIAPTTDQMTAVSDLAAALGKDFTQVGEAILDVNNTERWNEIGVKVQTVGNKIKASFKGENFEFEKSEKGALALTVALGKMQGVAGTSAAIAATLTGQLSNLQDKISVYMNEIGKGTQGAISGAIAALSNAIDFLMEFYKNSKPIGDVLTLLYDSIKQLGDALSEEFAEIGKILGVTTNKTEVFATTARIVAGVIDTVFVKPIQVLTMLAQAATWLIEKAKELGTAVWNVATTFDDFLPLLKVTTAAVEGLGIAFGYIRDKVGENNAKLNESTIAWGKYGEAVTDALKSVKLTLKQFSELDQLDLLNFQGSISGAKTLNELEMEFSKVKVKIDKERAKLGTPTENEILTNPLVAMHRRRLDDLEKAYRAEVSRMKQMLFPEAQKQKEANKAEDEAAKKRAEQNEKWLEAQYKSLRDLIQKEEDATQKLKDDAGRDSLAKIVLQNKREREVMEREMQELRAKFKEELKEKGIKESAAGAQRVFAEMAELQAAIGNKLDQQLQIATKKYKEGATKLISEANAAAVKEGFEAEIAALKALEQPTLQQRELLVEKELQQRFFLLDDARQKEIKDAEAQSQARADIFGTTFEAEMERLTNGINAKYSKRFEQATVAAARAVSDAIMANTRQLLGNIKDQQDEALNTIAVGESEAMIELNKAYEAGKISHEDYEATKTATTKTFARVRLQETRDAIISEIKAIEAAILDSGTNAETREKLTKMLSDLRVKLAKTDEELSVVTPEQKRYEKAQKYIDAIGNLYGNLSKLSDETIGKELKREEEKYNRLIAMQERRVSRAQAAAEKGNAAAAAFEQERLDRYIQKREEVVQRERELQAIQTAGAWLLAAAEGAAAIAKAAFEGGALAPITIAATVAGLLAGGAAVVSNFANMQGDANSSLGGFYDGGYTGDVGRGEVAGLVHGQEYVMTAEATSRIGVGNLDKMNYGAFAPDLRREGVAVQNINVGLDPVVGELKRQTAMMRGDKRAALNDSRAARGNTGITRR